MGRLALVLYALILSTYLLPTNLTLANGNRSDNPPNAETQKGEDRQDLFSEYKKAQGELWRDYQKLRDELINGYLSGRLLMTYEEFRAKQQALIDRYMEGKARLLNKYFNDKKNTKPSQS